MTKLGSSPVLKVGVMYPTITDKSTIRSERTNLEQITVS